MPVFDSQNYEFIRFNGNPDVPSPYKGPPSPAVDAMWDSLWADNMLIPQDLYIKSRPQYPEARVESTAAGHGGFFATFEATHQLHCLYTLFRASYVDYYEAERKFLLHNPDKYHARLDHCTDMLRQKIMCDSDATVVTYNWVRDEDRPVPDYSVLHKCRKHNELLEWSKRHSASKAVFNKSLSTFQLEEEP
ncbi:hypothetical protein DPV78_003207 [Talaromyces pinophilus]|nr:hypothetical protein DPV78_003207 [Talaromyces pinophilus]